LSVLQKGTKAPQAAGKIHTDFEKGFIMAEVMKFDDFKNEGSEAAVKVFGIIPTNVLHLFHSLSVVFFTFSFLSPGRRKI
jgi:obg-like ATPase 1